MNAELAEALRKRQILSGEVQPTGGAQIEASVSPDSAEALAAIQVQSLLIGGTQSLASSNHGSLSFFLKQIRDIVAACPDCVEELRAKHGLNLSDRINRLEALGKSIESDETSNSTTPVKPVKQGLKQTS